MNKSELDATFSSMATASMFTPELTEIHLAGMGFGCNPEEPVSGHQLGKPMKSGDWSKNMPQFAVLVQPKNHDSGVACSM